MNMHLPSSVKDFSTLLTHLGNKRVAQVAIVLLVVYIAFISAKITWLMAPSTQSNPNNSSQQYTVGNNNKAKSFDVSKIQSLNLFGEYTESEAEAVEESISEVPETSLNLVLSGLVASDDKSIAAAIIEHQGVQETYGIGDIIKGTRASLEQVLMDRVLIKQSGRLETLMLDGFDYNQPVESVSVKAKNTRSKTRGKIGPKSSGSGVVDQRNNEALTKNAKNLRKELSSDPAKMSDYLRISPKRKDGDIVGYSLRPGKKPEFFKLSGLKSGDVAIGMNGYDLTDTTQAMQAMVEMKQARDISLLIDRQGSTTEILISLD